MHSCHMPAFQGLVWCVCGLSVCVWGGGGGGGGGKSRMFGCSPRIYTVCYQAVKESIFCSLLSNGGCQGPEEIYS